MNLDYPYFNEEAENQRKPNNKLKEAMNGNGTDSLMKSIFKLVLCIDWRRSFGSVFKGCQKYLKTGNHEKVEIRVIKRFTVDDLCWKDPVLVNLLRFVYQLINWRPDGYLTLEEQPRVECKKHYQKRGWWIWQFLKTLFIMTFFQIMPIKKRDSRR